MLLVFIHFLWCPQRAASCGEKHCFCLVQFRLLLHVIWKLRMLSLSYTHTHSRVPLSGCCSSEVTGTSPAALFSRLCQSLCWRIISSSPKQQLFFSLSLSPHILSPKKHFCLKTSSLRNVCLFDSSSPLIFTPAGWDLIGASSAWNTAAVLVLVRKRCHFVAICQSLC